MILKYQLGQLQTNCYFLIKENKCLVIDPADSASFILEELQRKKLQLVGLLTTHGHFDHVGAAGEIQLTSNVLLYFFKEDQFLIDRMNETAEYFLGHDPGFIKPISLKRLSEGKIKIGDFEIEVIACPGHTPGGCSFYIKEEKSVFTGDTLFKQSIGRYDFKYCNKTDLKKSLNKILKLPKNTLVYPGHGEMTKIKDEMAAPFMIV